MRHESQPASPALGMHPVHGAEDEGDAKADGHACGVVVGRAPVAPEVFHQQVAQLLVQRLRVAAGEAQRQCTRALALLYAILHRPLHKPTRSHDRVKNSIAAEAAMKGWQTETGEIFACRCTDGLHG